MAKHYKIVYGFGDDDYLPIIGDELPKAIALFMERTGRGVFSSGAITGSDIKRIVPDWHTAMGWTKGYKLTTFDYQEIKPLEEGYNNIYNKASKIAEFALSNNRRDLLALPASEAVKQIPMLDQLKEVSDEVKKLANGMKI